MITPNYDAIVPFANSDEMKKVYNKAMERWIWKMKRIWVELPHEDLENLKEHLSLDWNLINELILEEASVNFGKHLDDKMMDEIECALFESLAISNAVYDAVSDYAEKNGWPSRH